MLLLQFTQKAEICRDPNNISQVKVRMKYSPHRSGEYHLAQTPMLRRAVAPDAHDNMTRAQVKVRLQASEEQQKYKMDSLS